jgi:hypothetical protein
VESESETLVEGSSPQERTMAAASVKEVVGGGGGGGNEKYMSGFGNEFATEAVPGTLPNRGNTPQVQCSGLQCVMHDPTTSSLHPPSLPHTFTLSVCAVVACPCAESGVTPGCRKLPMACTPSSSRARRSLLLATRIRGGAPPPETPDLDCFLQPTSHHCHPHPAAAASNMFDPSLNRTLVAFAHTV